MKNDIFNPKRFIRLLVADLGEFVSEHSINLIIFSLVGLAMYLIVGVLTMIFGGDWYCMGLAGRTTFFVITWLLYTVVTPAKVYGKVTDKKAGTMFLQLPASSLEKTLSMVVVCCLAAPALFFAIAMVADMLICLVAPGAGDAILLSGGEIKRFLIESMRESNSSNVNVIRLMSSFWFFADDFIQNILFFLLGAVIFKTAKTAKTFGCLMVLGSIMGTITMAILIYRYADKLMDFVNTYGSVGANDYISNTWIGRYPILFDTISDTVVNLGLIALIWLRIKKIKH